MLLTNSALRRHFLIAPWIRCLRRTQHGTPSKLGGLGASGKNNNNNVLQHVFESMRPPLIPAKLVLHLCVAVPPLFSYQLLAFLAFSKDGQLLHKTVLQ